MNVKVKVKVVVSDYRLQGTPIYDLPDPISVSRLRGGKSGRSWIRTSEGISQQIYSLPRLATSVSARERERLAKKRGAVKSDPRTKTWPADDPSPFWKM